MNKTFALAEVKALDTTDPYGEFEAVLSAPTLDRDGEVIETNAFAPLPASIPVHAFHDFNDPIGRGMPEYRDGVLYLRGHFASTSRAQEIRTLVAEGVIANMSVGFMSAEREERDGVPHVVKGEILEGSFVSIPSNREAAVLVAKHYEENAISLKATKADRLQAIHDLAVANGAACETKTSADDSAKEAAADPEEKAAAPAAAAPPADVTGNARRLAELARAEVLLT